MDDSREIINLSEWKTLLHVAFWKLLFSEDIETVISNARILIYEETDLYFWAFDHLEFGQDCFYINFLPLCDSLEIARSTVFNNELSYIVLGHI